MNICNINSIGKYRNGKTKYWCSIHFAFAHEKNKSFPTECINSNKLPIKESDRYQLDLLNWEGGVGIWGALNPVFNTSNFKEPVSGIHLHTRVDEQGQKLIDYSFNEIDVKLPATKLFDERGYIKLTSEIAKAYTTSMVFGKEIKYLECSHCKMPHIDADYFAVTYHKKHLCTYCGREFRDIESGIANPVIRLQKLFHAENYSRTIELVDRKLELNQKDFIGGLQIWGSNPAIIWTAKRREEAGIHIHAFDKIEGYNPTIDDTFGIVIIDGIELNSSQIRCLMVQKELSYLNGKIISINCPECSSPHFDKNDFGIRPHLHHLCEYCNCEFTTQLKCVSNPIVEKLEILKKNYTTLQK